MYIPDRNIIEMEQRTLRNADKLDIVYNRSKVGMEPVEKIRKAYVCSTLRSIGIQVPLEPGAENFPAEMRCWEIGKALLLARGFNPPQFPDQIADRTISLSDWGYAMDDVFAKVLEVAERENQQVHKRFTDVRFVENYLPFHANILEAETPSSASAYGGEYQYGKFSDYGETAQVERHGKIYGLSAKSLREKTLAETALAVRAGIDAMYRYEGDKVAAVLTSGTTATMGDGVPLFHASHSNYQTTGGPPGLTTLNSAINAMMDQKLLSDSTKSAGIIPRYLLVAPALKSTAENVVNSIQQGNFGINPITVLVDHRLGDSTGNDAGWYLMSDKAVSLFYLTNSDRPFVDIHPSWRSDNIEIKISHNFTAAALDWRRVFYNDGVT